MRASWEDAAVDHGTTREGSIRYRLSRGLETYAVKRIAGDVPSRGPIPFQPNETRDVVLHLSHPGVYEHRWLLTLGLVQDRGRTLDGRMLFDLRKKAPRG